ncbi:agmatinase [Rhodospirillaceae bacterium KN72]|uniref:Agmatinase n=1 Tax=Pacificispira spongiicola TaxID=2729598 RepID=A0A7Y0E0W2_9PROT|nr:agmatinase [Pacificispira spongiicola]NMM45164.1 agmatinase [Pacificispira spongiicola]
MTIDRKDIEGDQAFRGEGLLGRGHDNTFSGALSFLRRKYSRDVTGADIAVVGVPFDLATTNRSGARLGPRAMRAGSAELSSLNAFPFGFDPFDYLGVVDWGDIYFDWGHGAAVPGIITKEISGILSQGAKTLCLGGDHFITYPILKAYYEKYGPIRLVHFDAHCDTWPDDGTRMDHGSMFARAATEGIVIPEKSVQVGLRTWNDDDYGFTELNAPWVHKNGVQATIDKILEVVGTDGPAYMTFDIDCLDPAFAPGTGTPVSGGLSSAQALEIVRALGPIDWVGADVVEVAPAYDHGEITALAAATIAHDWLCLMAEKKRGAKNA